MNHPYKETLSPVMHEIVHMISEAENDIVLINNVMVEMARKLDKKQLSVIINIMARLSHNDPSFHT